MTLFFDKYMAALAEAMRQELPDITETRAEFRVDDIPYVFTTEEDSSFIFVYAVLGALPQDEDVQNRVFAGLLHAQYCFSESCGFSFGVDADNSFVILQALVDTEVTSAPAFVLLMDKFVKAANIWHKRLGNVFFGETGDSDDLEDEKSSFIIQA